MNKIAIALLNYNGRKHLEEFLPSVMSHSGNKDTDVYLIDNGSTDNSLAYIEEKFPQVKIIRLEENFGFAGGYNRGLKEINSEYFILLNTDVEVTENWLQPVVDFLDVNSAVSACQPKILSYRDKTRFEYAGASGGFIDYLGYPFCRGRILRTLEKDLSQYDTIIDVFWATGACLFIRSEAFWRVGGFDDNFFAHMEEIDLCWRMKSRGERIVCVPQSVVYHLGGGTLQKENPKKTYLNYRNNLLMLYKNLPNTKLKKTLFVRWFLDYLSAFVMLLSSNFSNAISVFKARSDFKKMKKEYADIRKENQSFAKYSEFTEILPKSIILNYYFLGNKTFKRITKK
jgi:GT2 family glycosyltransferase